MMDNLQSLSLILALICAPLATWRLSSMLSDTEQAGPFGLLAWVRYKAGVRFDDHAQPYAPEGGFGEGLLCVYCSSIWIGVFYTAVISLSPIIAVLLSLPLALSACAVIIDKWVNHA